MPRCRRSRKSSQDAKGKGASFAIYLPRFEQQVIAPAKSRPEPLDVRGSETVPLRADIDPGVLKVALPHVFMLNMVDPDMAVYRLVGTAHRARWGIELTGHIWGEFLDDARRIERTRRLWQAVERPCGFAARYELVFASGALDPVETLLLPLRARRAGFEPARRRSAFTAK